MKPKSPNIHSSHKMTRWKEEIVTLVAEPRFGRIRECKYCHAEQAETVAGKGMHPELLRKCLSVPKKK